LTLHFDELSVLSLSKEAALPFPSPQKTGRGAAEWVKFFKRLHILFQEGNGGVGLMKPRKGFTLITGKEKNWG